MKNQYKEVHILNKDYQRIEYIEVVSNVHIFRLKSVECIHDVKMWAYMFPFEGLIDPLLLECLRP